jgi:tetratricopeptide (TPR) repeat protein
MAAPASAAATLPVLAPDGGLYTDADVFARGLPEAPYPGQGSRGLFPQTPAVRKLTDEGWLAASYQRESSAHINFTRALRIAPNDRRLLWAYGWGMLNLDRPAQALEAFQRNLALRPGQRPMWAPMALALTYMAAGQGEIAVQWYRTAAASDPLRFGDDNATLRTTLYWTTREQALVRELIRQSARIDAATPGDLASR